MRRIDASLVANFFDLSVDACVVAGQDGYFKAVNKTFQRLVGIQKKNSARARSSSSFTRTTTTSRQR